MSVGEKPLFHLFEPEISRRLRRNNSKLGQSIAEVLPVYDRQLQLISVAEETRYKRRIDEYLVLVRKLHGFNSSEEGKVNVLWSDHPRCDLKLLPHDSSSVFSRCELTLNLRHPGCVSTQEEFFHACEARLRKVDRFLDFQKIDEYGMDFGLGELVSGMVHLTCLVDQALTLGAEELGRLDDLRETAKLITIRDANNVRPFIHYRGVMGHSLNERFQYSPIPPELLDIYWQTVSEDLETYLNGFDYRGYPCFREEMGEALQLLSLAYGERFLPFVFDLLDCNDVREVIKKAACWITQCLGSGEGVDDLVRHQVPLRRKLIQKDLVFPVGDRFVSSLSPSRYGTEKRGVSAPRVVTLYDFSLEAIVRKQERLGVRK